MTVLLSTAAGVVDRGPALRDDERVELLRAAGWVLVSAGVLFATLYAALGAGGAAVVCAAATAACGLLLWQAAAETRHFARSSAPYITTLYVALAAIAAFTGGWEAPALPWLLLVPMLATLLLSIPAAVAWGGVSAATVVGFYVAWEAGVPLADCLFEPFLQCDASTTREYGGTGLGLAICRQLVQAMGGRIVVQSQPGAGTALDIDVTMPRLPDEPASLAVGPSGPLRVLIGEAHGGTRRAPQSPERHSAARRGGRGGCLSRARQWAPRRRGRVRRGDLARGVAALGRPARPDGAALAGGRGGARPGQGRRRRALTRPVRPSRLCRRLLGTESGFTPTPRALAGEVPPRVLVAEDNPINQRVIRAMLAQIGAVATVVENGQGALDALAREPFDLVLMDIQMPVMDGETAVRQLRTWPDPRRDTPVVALTAHALAGDRERFLAAGMNDHLPKPVTLRALELTLARWVPHRMEPPDSVRTVLRSQLDALRRACEVALDAEDAVASGLVARRLHSAAVWGGEMELAAACAEPEAAPPGAAMRAAWQRVLAVFPAGAPTGG